LPPEVAKKISDSHKRGQELLSDWTNFPNFHSKYPLAYPVKISQRSSDRNPSKFNELINVSFYKSCTKSILNPTYSNNGVEYMSGNILKQAQQEVPKLAAIMAQNASKKEEKKKGKKLNNTPAPIINKVSDTNKNDNDSSEDDTESKKVKLNSAISGTLSREFNITSWNC